MLKFRTTRKDRFNIAWIIILVIVVIFFFSSTVFRRYVTLGMADVYDFKHLPVKEIPATPSNFEFHINDNLNFDGFTYRNKAVGNFEDFLETHYTNAFIVIRNDSILYEKYFNNHHVDSLCKVFSITKNVLSTLVGIAIEKQQIKSINDPLVTYIPELQGKGLDNLSVYHCMNGTAGLKYSSYYLPFSDEAKMYYKTNIRKHLQSIRIKNQPGTNFDTENYSPQLLGWVLENASNSTITDYLQNELWEPLGLGKGKFVVDSEKHQFEKSESGLVIRPIDLMKFGRLWLNNGQWNNKEIIAKNWIESSLSLEEDNKTGLLWTGENKTEFYKNMWWGFTTDGNTTKYSANGHFGQRLVIVPEDKLIILRLGSKSADVSWGAFVSDVIRFLKK